MDAVRDERVWRGGAIVSVLGSIRRDHWFYMEWMTSTRGQVSLCVVGRRRLQRLMMCFHEECGFVNCVMFRHYDSRADVTRCGVCNSMSGDWYIVRQRWQRWAQITGFKHSEGCICGRWCHDERNV